MATVIVAVRVVSHKNLKKKIKKAPLWATASEK